jgi:predicted dienelactone hydrolase
VEHQRGKVLTQFLTRDLSRVRTHSVRDAKISDEQPSYPVVVMRGGFSGLVAGYTSLAEDLASHGYVVVGFDAPYLTSIVVFPDGRRSSARPWTTSTNSSMNGAPISASRSISRND